MIITKAWNHRRFLFVFVVWSTTLLTDRCAWAVLDVEHYPLLMPNVQPQEVDSYFCTSVRLDPYQTSYIVGFKPNATKETAHHIIVYGCEEPGSEDDVWDCGEMVRKSSKNKLKSGPVCKSGTQVIYAWAHDAPKLDLPKGVGFKIGRNSRIQSLVLQVHYASVWRFVHDKEKDNSGIVLSITDERMPKNAGVYVLGTNGRILPKTIEHMETICRIDEDVKMHPFAFRTHTHALGRVVSGYLVRKRYIIDFTPNWSLIGKKNPQLPQMFYPVKDPKMVITKGDMLAARCTMVSNRNHTTYVGPTSEDEMCNFYVMYWVDGENTLRKQNCFSLGPPIFYWKRLFLFNAPYAETVSL